MAYQKESKACLVRGVEGLPCHISLAKQALNSFDKASFGFLF